MTTNMMREEVCIVLNEREPAKAKAAAALQAKLEELNITASRLRIDRHVQKVLHTRVPRIVVLDYLIGDFSTGLDILHSFLDLPEEARPRFIFLTDEPSVPVAVEAMRLGAADYLELDHAESIQRAVANIRRLLENVGPAAARAAAPPLSLSDLTTTAPSSIAAIEQARVLCLKAAPIIVVHGAPGSGVSTIMRAMALEKYPTTRWAKLDWRCFDQDLAAFCGLDMRGAPRLRLGEDLSLLVDNHDDDEAELLDFLARRFDQIWNDGANTAAGVMVGTHSWSTAQMWQRSMPVELLSLPPLKERAEDIAPLAQHFLMEAGALLNRNIKLLDEDLAAWLGTQAWQDNVRELRGVMIDAAIRSTFSRQSPLELVAEARQLWELTRRAPAGAPEDAYTAAAVLSASGHNFRIAAARLGCSPRQLRELLPRSLPDAPETRP